MDKTGIISHVERLGVSMYGNPYYRVHFEDGTSHRTQIDSVVSYTIDNSDVRGIEVSVKLTKAGRIYNVTPVQSVEV